MRRGYDVSQLEAAHRKRTAVSALLIFLAIPAAVSYTHLDVYKRQIKAVLPGILFYQSSPDFLYHSREIILRPKNNKNIETTKEGMKS